MFSRAPQTAYKVPFPAEARLSWPLAVSWDSLWGSTLAVFNLGVQSGDGRGTRLSPAFSKGHIFTREGPVYPDLIKWRHRVRVVRR